MLQTKGGEKIMVKKITPFNRVIEDQETFAADCNCRCQGEVGIPGMGAAVALNTGRAFRWSNEDCRRCGGGCGCSCGSGSQSSGHVASSANVPLHS